MLPVIIVFVAVLLGTVGLFLVMSRGARRAEADRVRDRLLGNVKPEKETGRGKAPALFRSEEGGKGKLAIGPLKRLELNDRLSRAIETAGLHWHVERFLNASLACGLGAFLFVWNVAPSPFDRFAFLAGPLAACLPLLYVLRKGSARLRKFEEQFPESLEFVARSMRAGHAFSVSLEMLHREFQEPLAGEFRRTFDEQNLGLPLDVALEKLAKRIPLLDVHFFVSAVLLQKRTGGNLAELLDKLAYLIRERFKLRGRIRAVSAHGRMTGTVLSLIPAAVAVIMFYVNPDYVMFFFTDTLGQGMMGGAIALQLVGYGIIRKIVAIEV